MSDGEEDSRPALADQRDVGEVYQPAEDSGLLADAALEAVEATDRVLDVGTGSGYVARRIAEETGARVYGSDLNPAACRQARDAGVSVFRGDLLAPIRDGSLDVVTCNPPYLPTDPDNEWGDPMEAALSGGETGRAVIEPLLSSLARVLRPGGRGLVLVSTLSDLDAVTEFAAGEGLGSREVAAETFPFERLVVVEFHREPVQPDE